MKRSRLYLISLCLTLIIACGGGGGGTPPDPPIQARGNCIPEAMGVPGQPGPPAWWGGGSGSTSDPRWMGALSNGHVNNDAQMRVLRYVNGDRKYLVLSWEVKNDGGPANSGEDLLYVGFWDSEASRGNIIRITRTTTTSVTDGVFISSFTAETWYRDDTTAGAWFFISRIPAAPDWLQTDTLLDATCTVGPASVCGRWAIRMRIPIDNGSSVSDPIAGLPLPDTFRMWYQLNVEKFDTGALALVNHKWPATAVSVADFPVLTFPDPTAEDQWNNLDATSGVTSCPGGVNLTQERIFSDGGSSQITTASPNVFHIQATNNTSSAIDGNLIRARLRIANWGPVLFDSPAWIDLNPSSPSCAAATGTSAQVAPGADFDLTCRWTLTTEQQCQYRPDLYTCSPMPPTLNSRQCILAELYSATDVLFSRTSACREFTFE